jgi:hypothetical protein
MLRKIAVVSLLALLAACKTTQPIASTDEHPIPAGAQALPLSAIESAIVEAGARRGWKFEHIADGKVRARYHKHPWLAEADVLFTQRSYRIVHVSSKNLEKRNDGVERAYNRWTGNLDRDIGAKLEEIGARR